MFVFLGWRVHFMSFAKVVIIYLPEPYALIVIS